MYMEGANSHPVVMVENVSVGNFGSKVDVGSSGVVFDDSAVVHFHRISFPTIRRYARWNYGLSQCAGIPREIFLWRHSMPMIRTRYCYDLQARSSACVDKKEFDGYFSMVSIWFIGKLIGGGINPSSLFVLKSINADPDGLLRSGFRRGSSFFNVNSLLMKFFDGIGGDPSNIGRAFRETVSGIVDSISGIDNLLHLQRATAGIVYRSPILKNRKRDYAASENKFDDTVWANGSPSGFISAAVVIVFSQAANFLLFLFGLLFKQPFGHIPYGSTSLACFWFLLLVFFI